MTFDFRYESAIYLHVQFGGLTSYSMVSVYLLNPLGRKVGAHEEVTFLMITWFLKTPEPYLP